MTRDMVLGLRGGGEGHTRTVKGGQKRALFLLSRLQCCGAKW
jgi:hypothetical protein